MSDGTARPTISVVVPSYGCESCLGALHAALVTTLEAMAVSFELILVDDRSPQGDWAVITALAARDPRVRGVRLCRNFGQHNAIAAGLEQVRGDWAVVMDCDLQDPPAEIERLYDKAIQGYDCVFARRLGRTDAATKLVLGGLFHRLHGWVAGFDADAAVGNFSIISRRVVRELGRLREHDKNYALQVGWLGFHTAYVDITHAPRHAGESTYTISRQWRHAITTVLSQSTRPLYASALLGLLMAIGAGATAAWLVAKKLTSDYVVEGWTSVIVSLFFLFGVLFLNLGVIGLYLGSVFRELKGRPSFIVERTTFDADEGAQPTMRIGASNSGL